LTDTMRLDLRSTLTYQRTVGEAHADSLGIVYGDHTMEATNATFSGRLFAVFRQGELTMRPFVQAGLTHYLQYDNRLNIDSVAFRFQEADTSVFVAAGLDLEISSSLQLTVGVRQDHSADLDSIAGRLGFMVRLN